MIWTAPDWFVVAYYVATLLFALAVLRLGVHQQLHHFWIGAWAVAVGVFAGEPVMAYVGLALMLDDTLQHLVQLWRPGFRSPGHLLYRYTLYPLIRL